MAGTGDAAWDSAAWAPAALAALATWKKWYAWFDVRPVGGRRGQRRAERKGVCVYSP